ncbi:MAG TPA: carboxyltransferase domain-containing protein, partial [Acidimicrobiales bacterium]
MTPRVRPYGDRGLLVELPDTAHVVAWVDALRRSRPSGVAEVVPAAETVLVLAADGVDLPGLGRALQAVAAAPPWDGAADGATDGATDGGVV